ncbi:Nuclear import receptor [Coemansia sp. Benny D115]|nr:Nuclear import receptor [Coemansia sp. Benny D115]
MSGQSPSVSEVVNALNALYQGTSQEARDQANLWLGQFQKTPQAWETSNAILCSTDLGLEARLFAAQTLRNKIISDLAELGEASALILRDSVVSHLRNARNGPQPLITQLCLSLADLAVQLGAWADPFTDMTGSFLSDPESVSCLLEFLAVLPEEVLNERILLPTEFFHQRSDELLTQKAPDLIQLLVQCLQQPDLKPDAHTKVLNCFTSWLKNGEITLVMIENTPLIELSFAALRADEGAVFDTAVDAICGIIQETHIDRDDEPNAVQAKDMTVDNVLVPLLNAVASQMRADPLVSEGDEERVRGYCRIFTEAGEAWVDRIISSITVYDGLVAALVDCMRLDNLEVIAMLFEFWNKLASATLEYTTSCDNARRSLVAVFEAIIDIIIRHLKYPVVPDSSSDANEGMTAKERDEFREFRHNIGDVLKDCVRVVGPTRALSHPYNIMSSGIDGALQVPWQEIEAPLFALRAMGAEIEPSENEMLPKIMDMFARFPTHPKLRYAATLVIGRYTEWTFEHPQYVQFQLNYIAEGFKVREVAAASAQSLKYLCQDCSKYLAEHWTSLMTFFNEVVNSGTLEDSDTIEFSEALAHVVSAVPHPDTSSAIESFCLPIGQMLTALLQTPEPGERERHQIALLLDRLGVFLRFMYIKDNEPAETLTARIIGDSWPLMSVVLQRFASDPLISESVCKFMRILIEFYTVIMRPIVAQLVDSVVSAFQLTGMGVYLWLARRIVKISRSLSMDESASLQLAISMVERMSEAALALFRGTSFSDIPETTEEYFKLIEKAAEVVPTYLLTSSSFPFVFQAAIAALEVNQYHAQLAVVLAWNQILGPTKRHLRLIQDSRTLHSSQGINSSGRGNSSASPASPLRSQRRRGSVGRGESAYPVEQVVELCVKHGFELTVKLLYGIMHRFDREVVGEAIDVFSLLAAIVSDGPNIVKAQFENPPLPTMYEWVQAMLTQVPEANFSAGDKQALLYDLSEQIRARQWPKIKVLLGDFSAVFWRRNSNKT